MTDPVAAKPFRLFTSDAKSLKISFKNAEGKDASFHFVNGMLKVEEDRFADISKALDNMGSGRMFVREIDLELGADLVKQDMAKRAVQTQASKGGTHSLTIKGGTESALAQRDALLAKQGANLADVAQANVDLMMTEAAAQIRVNETHVDNGSQPAAPDTKPAPLNIFGKK